MTPRETILNDLNQLIILHQFLSDELDTNSQQVDMNKRILKKCIEDYISFFQQEDKSSSKIAQLAAKLTLVKQFPFKNETKEKYQVICDNLNKYIVNHDKFKTEIKKSLTAESSQESEEETLDEIEALKNQLNELKNKIIDYAIAPPALEMANEFYSKGDYKSAMENYILAYDYIKSKPKNLILHPEINLDVFLNRIVFAIISSIFNLSEKVNPSEKNDLFEFSKYYIDLLSLQNLDKKDEIYKEVQPAIFGYYRAMAVFANNKKLDKVIEYANDCFRFLEKPGLDTLDQTSKKYLSDICQCYFKTSSKQLMQYYNSGDYNNCIILLKDIFSNLSLIKSVDSSLATGKNPITEFGYEAYFNYQAACTYKTIGEANLSANKKSEALSSFQQAIKYFNEIDHSKFKKEISDLQSKCKQLMPSPVKNKTSPSKTYSSARQFSSPVDNKKLDNKKSEDEEFKIRSRVKRRKGEE